MKARAKRAPVRWMHNSRDLRDGVAGDRAKRPRRPAVRDLRERSGKEGVMAAGRLPKPGTEFGPCPIQTYGPHLGGCEHTDCALTRQMAATACPLCGEPIGYDTRYYASGQHGLVHASCAEDAAEAAKKVVR